MARSANNSLLHIAKENKNDEFYTQLSDIEREVCNYKKSFYGKTVFCNCDNPKFSNFFKFFFANFKEYGLKRLICSCYSTCSQAVYVDYNGGCEGEDPFDYAIKNAKPLDGNGDFRSGECIELLEQSDIVVTNPPFSLFREFVNQLIGYNKQFLIIGNINAITYKEIFALIQNNRAWLGINLGRGISGFIVPESYELYGTEARVDALGNRIVSTNNCLWLTNIDNHKRHESILLKKKYYGNEQFYPYFDNYNAINVNRTQDIPLDFEGTMGVPITFLHKFNPEQFVIIKFRKGDDNKDLSINGKCPYFRILIRKAAGIADSLTRTRNHQVAAI